MWSKVGQSGRFSLKFRHFTFLTDPTGFKLTAAACGASIRGEIPQIGSIIADADQKLLIKSLLGKLRKQSQIA